MRQTLPVIDISSLLSGLDVNRRAVAKEIGRACRTWGFFYVTGHEIGSEAQAKVFDGARQFFELPLAVKETLERRQDSDNRGYVGFERERLDLNAAPDRKEAFNIGLELSPNQVFSGRPGAGKNVWPDIANWKPLMLNYFEHALELGQHLHRAFSLDLGLPETFFDDKLDRPMATLRLLHYPARDGTNLEAPGAGTHTDYGNLTLLGVDGVSGLEVRTRDGDWIDAPQIEGALLCNIGDCLMRWSNDTYVSTPHKVRVPERERYSIAFFLDPNADALVVPILTRSDEEAKYPPTTGGDFLRSRLDPTYQHSR